MKQTKENKRRASLLSNDLASFAGRKGQILTRETADVVADFLADLRHYCDAHDLDFADLDRRAYGNYTAEKGGL